MNYHHNLWFAALRNKQRGFTLIELMISLLLGILVLIAVSSVFISGKQAFGTTQGLNRIQENQRIAFEMMAADIRGAGSYACPGLMDPVWMVGNNGTEDWPETRYILAVGLEGNSPLASEHGTQHEAGFDSITLAMDSAISAISAGAERQYYPIKAHTIPSATSIELRHGNAHELNRPNGNYLVACNIDTSIVFLSDSNLSGSSIPVPLGAGLCGGGFSRNPPEDIDCMAKELPAKGYCFWSKLEALPSADEKQICGEWGPSQGFIVNLEDYKPRSSYSNAWYVKDRKGKGILVNLARGGRIAEGITGLELRYRLRGSDQYMTAEEIQTAFPSSTFNFEKRQGVGKGKSPTISTPSTYKFLNKWSEVDSVYLKMKFKTPDNIKGTDGELLERTMETYITVRSHKLEY